MIVNFSTDKFIERYLPLYKKTTIRLKWLRFLLSELKAIWSEFYEWRKDYLYRLNVTGQTLLLEYHLNKVIVGANNSIRIIHYNDSGAYVALEAEVIPALELGLVDEPGEETEFVEIAIEGEVQESIGVDFQVSIPSGVNPNEVSREIYEYKLAGVNFEIIQE